MKQAPLTTPQLAGLGPDELVARVVKEIDTHGEAVLVADALARVTPHLKLLHETGPVAIEARGHLFQIRREEGAWNFTPSA